MSLWTLGWLLILAQAVALEIAALCNKSPGDTLSEHVWWLYRHPSLGQLAFFMISAFLVWLLYHFGIVRIMYVLGDK